MFWRVSTLSGRTIVITACNSDIGFETFPCARSPWWARHRPRANTGGSTGRVSGSSTPVACDLADLDSVIAATNAVHTLGRLTGYAGGQHRHHGIERIATWRPRLRQLLLVIFRNGTLT